jgi:hypothetical protein
MYCVIQEVELKKENAYGEYKELKSTVNDFVALGERKISYSHTYSDKRFKRPIKKAYKISIHRSYREDGKIKKKQWVLGTMDYYYIATFDGDIGDFCNLQERAETIGITIDELYDIVSVKLDPLSEKIEKEYKETEEYKTYKKHREILTKYLEDKAKFEKVYGSNSYDYCYDVFGTLRNKEILENIKSQYEAAKEQQRKESENFKSNYNSYNSYGSYQTNKHSNYNEEDKSKYKKLYKTLAKAYHPDILKDNGEMMKIVNKLKEEWGI